MSHIKSEIHSLTPLQIQKAIRTLCTDRIFSKQTLKQETFPIINKKISLKFIQMKQVTNPRPITISQPFNNQMNMSLIEGGIENMDTKTEIDLTPYNTIYLQSKDQFEKYLKQWQNTNLKIHQQIQSIKANQAKLVLKNELKETQKKIDDDKIYQLEGQSKILNQDQIILYLMNWHQIKYPYRVACIPIKRDPISKQFWIYFQAQQLNQATITKDRLVLKQMQLTYSKYTKRIGGQFTEQINKKYVKLLIKGLETKAENQKLQRQRQIQEREERMKKFDRQNFVNLDKTWMKQFMQNWRDSAKEKYRKAQKKLFLQITKVKIDKKHSPSAVYCRVNMRQKQKLQYLQSQNDHFVYVNSSKTKLIYTFEVQQFYHQDIKFEVLTERSNNQSQFTSNLSLDKVYSNSLGFSFQLGLIPSNKQDIDLNFTSDFPYVICFESLVRKFHKNLSDVTKYRKIRALQNLGKIPDSYFQNYSFAYNPNNFKFVESLVSKNNFPLTKQSYEKTYLDLLDQLQGFQNSSKNFALFISLYKRKILSSNSQNCFQMFQRFTHYSNILQVDKIRNLLQRQYMLLIRSNPILVDSVNLSNLKEDIKQFQAINSPIIYANTIWNILHKLLIIIDIYNDNLDKNSNFGQKLRTEPYKVCKLRYCTGIIPIAIKIHQIVIYFKQNQFRQSSHDKQNTVQQQSVWLLFCFLLKYYPYSSVDSLKLQLYHIRTLAQKYLPQFCRKLNRINIGVQNYISRYFLTLFTQLNTQLNFRIWDFLIMNTNPMKAKIMIGYTLLLYMETTDLLPIIPINQFIVSARQNDYKIKLQNKYVEHFITHMDKYNANTRNKQDNIAKLAEQKYLKRFILSKNSKQLPTQNNKLSHDSTSKNTHLYSLSLLKYPLPQPNYPGFPVTQIHILVSNLFILETINLNKGKHILTFSYGTNNQQISISNKNVYINKMVSFKFNPQIKQIVRVQIFQVLSVKGQLGYQPIMAKEIYLQNYHKDRVYKININFERQMKKQQKFYQSDLIINEPHKNKGLSTLSVMLCLKSSQSQAQIKLKNNKSSELGVYERLLDYDWNMDSNQSLRCLQKFNKKVEQMKTPLDEFGKQQYHNIKLSAFTLSQDQWILSSKVSIVELKAIFHSIFMQEDETDLRLQFSSYYQLYTSQLNYQEFDLGLFLTQLILLHHMSRQKKITLLYCLLLHYQNTFSKSLTIQTIHSLIKTIHNQHGFLNPCPYFDKFSGQVQQGWLYLKGQKIEERKKDITEILQDWAYICRIKYDYGGLLLGSCEDLLVLRSLLPMGTLKQMMKEKVCRFEIIYRHNDSKYVWTVVVNSEDFVIVQRGNKFLNTYPEYKQISYIDSTAEILLNCQNLLPLQSNKNLGYEEFNEIIKNHHLFNYLLTQPSQDKLLKSKKSPLQPFILTDGRDLSLTVPRQSKSHKLNSYSDYGIYRYQNCLEEWRPCRIIQQQQKQDFAIVQFEFQPQKYYKIPLFQLINMSENLQWQFKQNQHNG